VKAPNIRHSGFFLALALLAPLHAAAQMSPLGVWRTVDAKTGESKAEIRITEAGGVLSGRIQRQLREPVNPDARCRACKDERKDQPIVGLEVIRGLRKGDGAVWEGGTMLDPEDGKEYKLRLTPVDGGKALEVRVSTGLLSRTLNWVRVP
jgi:uncharacterized protein (DUF2147 family)